MTTFNCPEPLPAEDLSDEEVSKLLEEAEARLQSRYDARKDAPTTISNHSRTWLPSPADISLAEPCIDVKGSIARARRTAPTTIVPLSQKQSKVSESAGPDWYDLPRTELTPELRRDLQLLKMRGVIDPKRHYKKDNSKADPPKYSAVGTIIEGPTEFYSSRVQNKDRKATLAEEVLAQEAKTGRFKRKYNEIQTAKTSGKKAYYKALKAKRKGRVEKR